MIVAAPDVLWGGMGQDLALFSVRDRRVHILNSSAALVWWTLAHPIRVDDVVDRIAGDVGLTAGQVRADVLCALAQFATVGICGNPSATIDHSFARRHPVAVGAGTIHTGMGNPIDGIRALGIPMVVVAEDDLLRAELAAVLAPLRSEDPRAFESERGVQHITVRTYAHGWQVLRNGDLVATPPTREAACRSVLSECNMAAIARIDDAVVLHAAGVDLGAGVVVFPGVSNAGKSTLAAQLVERGHRYLTDEAVAIELASLRTRPFTKALCLESGAQTLLPHLVPAHVDSTTWDVDPRSIGPGRLSAGGLIRAVVFPRFDATGNEELRRLEPLEFLRLLIANAFDFSHIGQRAFAALVRMTNTVAGYQLTHPGDADHLLHLESIFGDVDAVSL